MSGVPEIMRFVAAGMDRINMMTGRISHTLTTKFFTDNPENFAKIRAINDKNISEIVLCVSPQLMIYIKKTINLTRASMLCSIPRLREYFSPKTSF